MKLRMDKYRSNIDSSIQLLYLYKKGVSYEKRNHSYLSFDFHY
jgi:hypothetical protein